MKVIKFKCDLCEDNIDFNTKISVNYNANEKTQEVYDALFRGKDTDVDNGKRYSIVQIEIGLKPMDLYSVGEVVGQLKTVITGLISAFTWIKAIDVQPNRDETFNTNNEKSVIISLLISDESSTPIKIGDLLNSFEFMVFVLDLNIVNAIPETPKPLFPKDQNEHINFDEYMRFQLKLHLESTNPSKINSYAMKLLPVDIYPIITVVDDVELALKSETPRDFLQSGKHPNLRYLPQVYDQVGSFQKLRYYLAYLMFLSYKHSQNLIGITETEQLMPFKNLYEQLLEKFSCIQRVSFLVEKGELAITFQNFKLFNGYLPTIQEIKESSENQAPTFPYEITRLFKKFMKTFVKVKNDD